MYAWQFEKAQSIARERGFTQFVSMQNHYNLIYREEEREMIPLCKSEGIGIIPWSPLARGNFILLPCNILFEQYHTEQKFEVKKFL
jgi:aryl-alcohol dehydrogenase-like predicted oxidoreductase